MSLCFGQDDPLNILKAAFFSCLIGIYFPSFFFEHPVFWIRKALKKEKVFYHFRGQKRAYFITFFMSSEFLLLLLQSTKSKEHIRGHRN